MAERDSNSWSVMIAGYAQNGGPHEALALFREMQISDVDIHGFTLASIVGVCGELGALDLGKWAHSYIDRKGVEIDVVLGNSLVDMYAKCGLLDEAHTSFQRMDEKDVFVWSTMIGGYAIHGYGEKALQVFADMISANVRPTCVTFTSMLYACSHSGLIDEGCRCFDSMRSEYGIEPQIEHYGCMIDLFCQAGCINEAHDFISSMSIEPNVVLWRTLLSACKASGHAKLGACISRKLLELNPKSGLELA
ncbi:putative pentatricopeptide repeat-containing protein At5g40405 [Magnolia sinica]|uniref:putative pentatricopeptide repeat-containing protein At5g40405 n=1 Tax=Magnolia sinica TaxID=86752 RepID=UPI002658F4A7|nr:putative pentatricopeptide repeat-containing protein At5g40405 [Magnolia sinica]